MSSIFNNFFEYVTKDYLILTINKLTEFFNNKIFNVEINFKNQINEIKNKIELIQNENNELKVKLHETQNKIYDLNNKNCTKYKNIKLKRHFKKNTKNKNLDRGSGSYGEQNGIDFDQYERDPLFDNMSNENFSNWNSIERKYKKDKHRDRNTKYKFGYVEDSDDDDFIVEG